MFKRFLIVRKHPLTPEEDSVHWLYSGDPMSDLPRPTEFELAILRVLWRRETATVRQVFEDLKEERQLGYNTVLKTMLILLDKGLVVRDESERSHVYRASRKEQDTQASLLRDLLKRAFGGSSQKLMMAALKEAPLSPDEASEIKALLEVARNRRVE
jgi:predicted transcriptional regulator